MRFGGRRAGEIMPEMTLEELHKLIASHKEPDKQFYLDLLDADRQRAYEELHVRAVMTLLKTVYINKLKVKIAQQPRRVENCAAEEEFSAESYQAPSSAECRNKGMEGRDRGVQVLFYGAVFCPHGPL